MGWVDGKGEDKGGDERVKSKFDEKLIQLEDRAFSTLSHRIKIGFLSESS